MNLMYNSIEEMPDHLKFIPILFMIFVIAILIILIVSFFYWLGAPSRRQKKIMWTNQAIHRENIKQRQLLEQQLQEKNEISIIDQFHKLAYLKENNHINEEEYNYLKGDLLNKNQSESLE